MNAVVAVTRSVANTKVGKWAVKNAPQLLLTTGLVSGAGSLVSTVYATKRTIEALDAYKAQRAQELGIPKEQVVLTREEILKLSWKNYIVPAGMAVGAAAGCIAALHVEHGRALSLAALLGASESRLASMEAAIKEKLSENKATEIKEAADQKDIEKLAPAAKETMPTQTISDACREGLYWVYDPLTYLKKKMTHDRIDLAVANCDRTLENANLTHDTDGVYVSVADFLEEAGFNPYDIPRTMNNLVWRASETTNIGVRVATGALPDTGEPCWVLDYKNVRPKWEDLYDF